MNQEVTGKWKIRKLVLHGDYNGLINGFDVQNDILHVHNQNALMTGLKKVGVLDVHDVIVNFINDIDVDDWMKNAVRINSTTDQFIEGHISFKKFALFENNLRVYKTVNGLTITPQTVLMKNRENQVINGDVTFFIIDPRSPQMNAKSNQLFIQNFKLNGDINGRNWQELKDNVFKSDSDSIDSKVVFEKELRVTELEANNSIYGTDMVEFLNGSSVSNHMQQFKKNMEHLEDVGDDLVRGFSETVIELSHFEFIQTLNGKDIQKSVLFSSHSNDKRNYILAVHEKNSTVEFINFYKWNRENRKFLPDISIPSLSYSAEIYQITHFYKIVYEGLDHLFLEVFDRQHNIYNHNLLRYESNIESFLHVPIIQPSGEFSSKLFTWKDGSMACYGQIQRLDDKVFINCYQLPQTIIQIGEIVRNVSCLDDALIILTERGDVRVWRNQDVKRIQGINNPQSFSGIRYNDKYYLAIRTDEMAGTIYHGGIHIFESSVNRINFREIQKLSLHVPTAVQFSKAPSDDLLLYILTRNEPRAFYVYSYAGSSNFVPSIGEDTIIKKASDLDFIQVDGSAEMVSIVSGEKLYIIQAVLNEF